MYRDVTTTFMAKMTINGFELDGDSQRLVNPQGEDIALEPKMFDVLQYFCLHPNTVISKQELIQQVWQGVNVSDNAITRIIAKLRKAFGDSSKDSKFIRTVPRKGYEFIAQVEQITPINLVTGADTSATAIHNKVGLGTYFGAAISLLFVLLILIVFSSGETPPQSYHIEGVTSSSDLHWKPHVSPDKRFMTFISRGQSGQFYNLSIITSAGQNLAKIASSKGNIKENAISVDSQFIAFHYQGEDCQIRQLSLVRNLNFNSSELIIPCGKDGEPQLQYGQRGKYLYYTDRQGENAPYQIYRYNLLTKLKESLKQPVAAGLGNYNFDLSDDGLRLLILHADESHYSKIYTLDLTTQQLKLHAKLDYLLKKAVWSGDNETIVHTATQPSNGLWRRELNGNKLNQLVSSKERVVDHSRIPHTDNFVFTAFLHNIDISDYQLQSGEQNTLLGSSDIDSLPATAHQSSALAFISNRSGMNDVWLLKGNMPEPRQLSQIRQAKRWHGLSWSPDDTKLLLMARNHLFVMPSEGGDITELAIDNYIIRGASWRSNKEIWFSAWQNGNWQLMLYNFQSKQISKRESRWQAALTYNQQDYFIDKQSGQLFSAKDGQYLRLKVNCGPVFVGLQLNIKVAQEKVYCRPNHPKNEMISVISLADGTSQQLPLPATNIDFTVGKDSLIFSHRVSINANIMRTTTSQQ